MKSNKILVLFIFTILINVFKPNLVRGSSIYEEGFNNGGSILLEKDIDITTYYVDLDNNGVNERIEVIREAITPAYISYYIYDSVTEDILFSKRDIYRGVLSVESNSIIEKTPVYKENDFGIPNSYEENEYILKDGNIICSNSSIENKILEMQVLEGYNQNNYSNPSKEEIERIIDEVALNKGIPPTILKAIAYTESNYRQFKNGQPLLSFDGVSWGIMQVTPKFYPELDVEKLKYDIEYNLEAGANILLGKWDYGFGTKPRIPRIGTSDMRILENWYFAIWAYNGLSESNNPNLIPYYHKSWTQYEAYQDKVLKHAKTFLNQEIIPIPKQLLPLKGLPDPTKNYGELYNSKIDKYRLFVQNQQVKVNSSSGLVLRNENMNTIKSINNGQSLRIQGATRLYDGYLRYKVEEIFDNGSVGMTGWVASNWILPSGIINKGVQVWQNKLNVSKDYIWTVKFNLPVDFKTISQDTVYIEDNSNNKIPISVYYEGNNYDVLRIKPIELFKSGEKYTLFIKGLKTDKGNLLNENIQMSFIVKI